MLMTLFNITLLYHIPWIPTYYWNFVWCISFVNHDMWQFCRIESYIRYQDFGQEPIADSFLMTDINSDSAVCIIFVL